MEGMQHAVREYDNSYGYNGFDQQSQEFVDQILSSPESYSDSYDASPHNETMPRKLAHPYSLEVSLSHKPRGSKGVWQRVVQGDKLRVTKGKGKRLKLEATTAYEFDHASVQVQLIDLEHTTPCISANGFSVESAKTFAGCIELEVKLFKVCKRLQFGIQISSKEGGSLIGRSVEFVTHNSGTASTGGSTTKEEPELSSPEQDPIQLEPIVSEKKRRRPESTESEDVTIVPGSLHVKGEIVAKAFMQFSDERLKTNIVDLVDALQIVTSLQGKSYQWKADTGQPNEGGKRVIGLIAQQVQKVLPEVVHTDPETGYLSVSYAEILPVLIEAFKQFLKEYRDDKKEIQFELVQLRNKLDKLSELEDVRDQQVQEALFKNLTQTSQNLSSWFHQSEGFSYPPYYSDTEQMPTVVNITNDEDVKTKKTFKSFIKECKATQIVFSILFAVCFVMVIVGLVLVFENLPSEVVEYPSLDSSLVNSHKLVGEGGGKEHGWRFRNHVDGHAREDDDDDNGEPPPETTDYGAGGDNSYHEPTQTHPNTGFIFGIVLICLGTLGMIVSGIGLCCFTQTFLCCTAMGYSIKNGLSGVYFTR